MRCVREILGGGRFSGYTLIDGPVPRRDVDSEVRCRALCEANRCGQYGRTWACPPGFSGTLDDYSGRFSSAVVMKRTDRADPHDAEAMSELSCRIQDDMRHAVTLLRGEGYDCMGFADAGCTYCGVCAYPDQCRFPAMLIPSVSALGLDMGEYLGCLGEQFVFRDDAVTLYGLLLVGRPLPSASPSSNGRPMFQQH